jgi:hypothetical protein
MKIRHPSRFILCIAIAILLCSLAGCSLVFSILVLGLPENPNCYLDSAKRIGVVTTDSDEAYYIIVEYINSNLKKAASEQEVLAVLNTFSEVRETHRQITCAYPTDRCLPVTGSIIQISDKGCAAIEIRLKYKVADGSLYEFSVSPRQNWD